MAEDVGAPVPGPAARIEAEVCVVGAGPAGLALGLELARRGRRVAVLERKSGFERSFRGESMSPDAVWLLDRLGVLDRVRDSSRRIRRLEIRDGGRPVLSVDFGSYGWEFRHPLELPQPPLLAAMAGLAAAHPGFRLLCEHSASRLLSSGGRIVGVRGSNPDGDFEVRAALTIVADGRYSALREQAGLAGHKLPLDRDVLWLKLRHPATWASDTYAVRMAQGSHMVLIPSVPDQLRIGLNIPTGSVKQWRAQGLSVLYDRFDLLAPELSATVREQVTEWSDTSLLDVFTTVVPSWSAPGTVLIGDAAHTLSPILGLGVYHALADAVTLAPLVDAALGAADRDTALDEAAKRFQQVREPALASSRAAQLRQERAFTLSGPIAAALRRQIYRLVDRGGPAKRRLVTGLYYSLQSAVQDGRQRLELSPAATRTGETAIPTPTSTPTAREVAR